MNKRVLKIVIALLFTSIILGICCLANSTYLPKVKASSIQSNFLSEEPDMLVFLSPQYAHDKDILSAINEYAAIVKSDISWNVKTIKLSSEQNSYQSIDAIIEDNYKEFSIKACLLVGEDTDTALSGSSKHMLKPSVVPWETTGGNTSYEILDGKVVCKPYTIDICISLLYPSGNLDYQTKKTHIISAFNKFSSKSDFGLDNDILVFESSELNANSKDIYSSLENSGNLFYREDPTDLEVEQSKSSSYSMYFVHGHSNPSGTDVSVDNNGWFSAEYVNSLDSPLFGADGCYVGGWWCDSNTATLTSSVSSNFYGSKIFTSKNIVVMALGMLTQNGLSYPVSFIENVVPKLSNGYTLANSIIGNTALGDTIIIGDPTFHFTL